jgi:hypothetical protein
MNISEVIDPQLGYADASNGSNAPGNNYRPSKAELAELYRKALIQQAAASEAWASLLDAHIRNDSPWSRVLHCAEAAGVSLAELRAQSGATSSTLSRWSKGIVQPSRMLRARLERELSGLIGSAVAKMRAIAGVVSH